MITPDDEKDMDARDGTQTVIPVSDEIGRKMQQLAQIAEMLGDTDAVLVWNCIKLIATCEAFTRKKAGPSDIRRLIEKIKSL
jgi:hypothetical protein